MKRLESLFGIAALGFYALFGVLAVFVAGILIGKGTPDHTPAYIAAQMKAEQAGDAAAGGEAAGSEAAEAAAGDATAGAETKAAADVPPAPVPAAQVVATLDADAGKKVFSKCKACHTNEAGGPNRVGPALWGVLDRPVGSVADFKYSDAMLGHGGAWTPEELDAYLADPKGHIPGNKMAFAGLKKEEDRHNLIAWMAGQSDNPVPAGALPFGAAATAGAAVAVAAAEGADVAAEAAAEEEPAEIPQIAYTDPPEPTEDEIAAIGERLAALEAEIPNMDYERARHHPIHYSPAIDEASNEECLACHQEIMSHEVRPESYAGLKSDEVLAWYQTLDTYVGKESSGQSDFHWRHLESPLAQQTMNLQCNFCHRGNDVREESPDMIPARAAFSADPENPEFTLRKMVNPSETCLRCHGAMPDPENIMGLGGPWHEIRADMEDQSDEDPTVANGCLSCHGELFRTNRHNVTYLKAAGIEDLAQAGSDTCYGCHGGRQWYRISYPYPRHPWPGMDTEEVPEWAANRPTQSDARFQRDAAQQ